MSPTQTLILAIVDAIAFTYVGYSWGRPWLRARRQGVPLSFLTVLSLWAEGAPIHEMIDAMVMLRNAGTPATVDQLREAWWRDRYHATDAPAIARAARAHGAGVPSRRATAPTPVVDDRR